MCPNRARVGFAPASNPRPTGDGCGPIFRHLSKVNPAGPREQSWPHAIEEVLRMRRAALIACGVVVGLLTIPALALGDGSTLERLTDEKNADLAQQVAINSIWVLLCAILVMFMQAGFA